MPNKKMPQIKNEKQYEALKEEGYSKEKAARIANTENSGKKGGKSSKYEERTKKELYEKAKQVGIEGRSKMSKKEIINALRNM
jgi:CRISPR/Cas system-associated endonuclease Cas1